MLYLFGSVYTRFIMAMMIDTSYSYFVGIIRFVLEKEIMISEKTLNIETFWLLKPSLVKPYSEHIILLKQSNFDGKLVASGLISP